MKLSQKGFEFLTELEDCVLHPYADKKGIWTIGVGCTYYESGAPVHKSDPAITEERAFQLFENIAKSFEKCVNDGIKTVITQNQYDALFCFCWNVGKSGFTNSTILRMVNKNPNDKTTITQAFMMWKGGDNLLLTRQQKQIKHYFS